MQDHILAKAVDSDERKTAWTPGPWVAVRNSSYWEVDPENRKRHEPFQVADVCSSCPGDADNGLQEANARLIAAAPELYESLEEAVLAQPTDGSCDAWVSDARAALAKARGDT